MSGLEDSTLPDNTVIKIVELPAAGIEVLTIQPRVPNWVANIVKYLETGVTSEDKQEARKIKNRAARYTMIEGVLYWWGHSAPLLRCISPEEAQYVLA